MTFKKMHIFHKWTKWETTEYGEILRIRDDAKTGTYYVQKRSCTECGKLDIKTVKNRFL